MIKCLYIRVFLRGSKEFSPVPPLKNLSWVLLVPKMLLLTAFSLSKSSPLSPLGFSNSTTPSEEETGHRITNNDKIPCLEQPLLNFPGIPGIPCNMATGAEAYPSLQTMNNLHITQELYQALQILVF